MDYTSRDLSILALTILGEAGRESWDGKVAVAWSVRNRVEADLWQDDRPDWWGEGIAAVCLKAWQYSCWLMEPVGQGRALRSFLVDGDTGRGELLPVKDPYLRSCLAVASEVLNGHVSDPTHGSTHYYADYIAEPGWARGHKPVAIFGVHRFYNDVEPGYVPPSEHHEPTLRNGTSGIDVRRLQVALNQAWPRVEADGAFGPATVAAVKLFQRAHGLTADGIVGKKTWEALRKANPQGGN